MSETNGGNRIGSGTVDGLMAFLDFIVARGIGPAPALSALKSATRRVFEVVEGSSDVDDIEIRDLDVADYLSRFEVKARGTGRFKPGSIQSYRKRFIRTMEYYDTYLTTGETPNFRLRAGGGRPRREATPTASVPKPRSTFASSGESTAETPVHTSTADNLVSYPFPLQSGKLATLRLPLRLEKEDADRLGAFIRTLVMEPQKQLGMGHEHDE